MAQHADSSHRVFIRTNGNNALIRSLRNRNDIIHAGGPGEFTIILRPVRDRVVVRSIDVNQFRIDANNCVSYSFEIGYETWSMAVVTFERVPQREQSFFGQYQLVVNNNWRITSGPPPRVLNRRISHLRLNEARLSLFRVELDPEVQEPQQISVRIGTAETAAFATMFLASNQLLHVRFDAESEDLRRIYDRIQRVYVPDPMEWALMPSRVNRNSEFLGRFRQFENLRRAAIAAPPQRSQLFRRIMTLGIYSLTHRHTPDLAVAQIIDEIDDYLANEDHGPGSEHLAIMPPQIDDDIVD